MFATSSATAMSQSISCFAALSSPMKRFGDWEEKFLPLFTDQIRAKRKGKLGKIFKIDETYIRVKGTWCYLYRGIDEDGNLVDVRLSKTRDMEGTKAFFARAKEMIEINPDIVQTDGLASYPRAVKEELGEAVEHQVLPCTANAIEQSHQTQAPVLSDAWVW